MLERFSKKKGINLEKKKSKCKLIENVAPDDFRSADVYSQRMSTLFCAFLDIFLISKM